MPPDALPSEAAMLREVTIDKAIAEVAADVALVKAAVRDLAGVVERALGRAVDREHRVKLAELDRALRPAG